MIIHVTEVKVVGPHSLELTFDDGLRKRVNLRRELYGPIFEPLRDPASFAQVTMSSPLPLCQSMRTAFIFLRPPCAASS